MHGIVHTLIGCAAINSISILVSQIKVVFLESFEKTRTSFMQWCGQSMNINICMRPHLCTLYSLIDMLENLLMTNESKLCACSLNSIEEECLCAQCGMFPLSHANEWALCRNESDFICVLYFLQRYRMYISVAVGFFVVVVFSLTLHFFHFVGSFYMFQTT